MNKRFFHGYVAADVNGAVTEEAAALSSRWKEVCAFKDSDFSMTLDTEDDFVYMDAYVNYLVNTLGDATVDTHLLSRTDQDISLIQSDMNSNSTVNVFDLFLLKKKLGENRVSTENAIEFTQNEPGKWKITDAAAGKTVPCIFGGKGGYMATIVYGYWDAALNDGISAWVQDDATSFGSMKSNSNQEITVPLMCLKLL